MTTLNQLSSTDTASGADQLVVYMSGSGDVRKLSISALAAYIQAMLTTTGSFQTQYAAPNATGFSVTISPGVEGGSVYLLLTPVGAYAAGTIVLPSKDVAYDGQELLVSTTQAVTALTINASGATLSGAPTTLAANAFFRLRYDGTFQTWYRVG